MKNKWIILGFVLAAGVLILAACASPTPPTPEVKEVPVTVQVPVEVTRVVEVTVEPVAQAPFVDVWAASPHADKSAEAFKHWDTASPAEVPTSCAKCHSSIGFQDFLGADGSEAGKVDKAAPIGGVIDCQACHNPAAQALTSVTFPSGATLTGLGPEARCMQCHQGRAWGGSVDEAIQKAGLTDDDTVSPDLGFTNIHYFAAAITRHGAHSKGGYQYPGQSYDVLFEHVRGMDTCIDCHDQHSLQVKVDKCTACHSNVKGQEDLKNIRMNGSLVDYDGDGNTTEGIAFELDGVREKLFAAMQAYAKDVAGTPIVYSPSAYPYFFIDANANGKLDDGEAVSDGAYKSWTGRLAKAAFNYQMSIKDPGAFAHGGKYIIELLYDSTVDLNTKLSSPVDMTGMHRIDAGHFAGSEEAFRHWDEEGAVPGGCAKCHSGEGVPTFLANGVNIAVPPSNGFQCANCHNDLTTFTRFSIKDVKFPSGKVVSFGDGAESNLCITCHQGRESTASMNTAIKASGAKDDEVSDKLRFRNVHYFAAGATLFGDAVQGAYQFDGQTYRGQFKHGGLGPTECVQCHDVHALTVKVDTCTACHKTVKTEEDLQGIRITDVDFDGDGDTSEGLAGEVSTMQDALYAAMQSYATTKAGAAIVYSASSYPYFFTDKNGNGKLDTDEATSDNAYATWTPNLVRAAYNYQYAQKDPGKFAHNGQYMIQVLYDSIQAVGGDVSKMTRPETPAP